MNPKLSKQEQAVRNGFIWSITNLEYLYKGLNYELESFGNPEQSALSRCGTIISKKQQPENLKNSFCWAISELGYMPQVFSRLPIHVPTLTKYQNLADKICTPSSSDPQTACRK